MFGPVTFSQRFRMSKELYLKLFFYQCGLNVYFSLFVPTLNVILNVLLEYWRILNSFGIYMEILNVPTLNVYRSHFRILENAHAEFRMILTHSAFLRLFLLLT